MKLSRCLLSHRVIGQLIVSVISAGDLGVELDFGAGKPEGTLQRYVNGAWIDYMVNGKSITLPVKLETLPPGKYRISQDPKK